MRKRFLLRIHPELWEEISRWAGDELRSVNSQIEYLLRQAVQRRKRDARWGESQDAADQEADRKPTSRG